MTHIKVKCHQYFRQTEYNGSSVDQKEVMVLTVPLQMIGLLAHEELKNDGRDYQLLLELSRQKNFIYIDKEEYDRISSIIETNLYTELNGD